MITADTKKKSSKKQITANIEAVEVKSGIVETGVYIRFYTGSEYDRLAGAQRAELHNWIHSSSGKCSATGDPECGGCGRYSGRSGLGGYGRGRGVHVRGRGRGRGNFESQVAAIIAKTAKNEANKLTNAQENVAAAASSVNGSFQGIPPPVPTTAPNLVVFAADLRKQQPTEYLNWIVGRE